MLCGHYLYDICTNCNTTNKGHARFCSICGGSTSLREEEPLYDWVQDNTSINFHVADDGRFQAIDNDADIPF